ncbi:MAG: helix-turn-helix domain-containing protein [Candidatus Bilamarchaeaceae archaeon]
MENINDVAKALVSAGLSAKEAVVYLDLLSNGESQTGKICERTRIPSSYIYGILSNLMKKGLVNYKLVNNIKVFRASEPDALLQLFEEKEKALKKEKVKMADYIAKIKLIKPKEERLSDFKYFQGLRGIKSLYTEIINSWKKGDEYYIASAPQESFFRLEAFFIEVVHRKRINDGVKLKIIINQNSKKWGLKRARMPLTEVRYLDIDTKTEYGVLNEYFFLVNYGLEPYGLLIKDKNFAETYKVFFDLLWNQARPL